MKPRIYQRYGIWVLNYAGTLYRFAKGKGMLSSFGGWEMAVLAVKYESVREVYGHRVLQEHYYLWL